MDVRKEGDEEGGGVERRCSMFVIVNISVFFFTFLRGVRKKCIL